MFHFTEEDRRAALTQAYLELQLPLTAALQAAQADIVLLD